MFRLVNETCFNNYFLHFDSKHVVSEDVIHRSLLPDGKRLYSQRLLTKTNRMPRWGNVVFGANAHLVSVIEESVVDPIKKTLTTYTRNLGYTTFMVSLSVGLSLYINCTLCS